MTTEAMVVEKKEERKRKRGESLESLSPVKRKKETKEKKEKKEKKERKKERKEKKEKKEKKERKEKKEKKDKKDKKGTEEPQTSEKTGTNLKRKETEEFHQEHEVQMKGKDSSNFAPITSFGEAKMSASVLKICQSFSKPTPIQSLCWPVLLANRHLIAIAETGSGKTLAFALPGLTHILSQNKTKQARKRDPQMLVLSPTRELATQSAGVIEKASHFCGLSSLCVYGGVSKLDQKNSLRGGVDIVVGTPGRLLDLLSEHSLVLNKVKYLVLDEADRMLDDGFEKEVRTIIQSCPKERQMAMFSATWPESVEKLAHQFLIDPIQITVGNLDLSANKRITQIVEVIDQKLKEKRILELLKQYHNSRTNRVLVFALYKKEAARLESYLNRRGWNCVSVHGDKKQSDRTEAVNSFIDGTVPLLIATDVAARGLDIPGVEVVINYTFPLTIEDYVHRIGRTARAGKTGISHTLFTLFEKPRAGELVQVLEGAGQTAPPELVKFGPSIKKKKEHAMYGAWTKDIDTSAKATRITFDSDDED